MPPRYLRVSVTTRCNLRCFYCRPGRAEEERVLPEPSVEDLALLVRCAAEEGVRKVRLTGGEPLMREDLEAVVGRVSATPGVAETALTTNGIGLATRAAGLKQAGLDRANISLDTLRGPRFLAITGHDRLNEVTAGIDAAARVFDRVKINTVLLRGRNEDEIGDLVRFAAERGLRIRFIENYPCAGAPPTPGGHIPVPEIKERLEAMFGTLEPMSAAPLSVERTYRVPSVEGVRVGLIAAASGPACATCAKLRFTGAAELLPCLFAESGVDLAPLLRRQDAAGIRRAVREAFAAKRRSGPRDNSRVSAAVNIVGG